MKAVAFLFCAVVVLVALDRGLEKPPILLKNEIGNSGIDFVLDNSATPAKHQPETMISGVAIFDYNNDGLMDIYFVNGAKLPDMDKSDPRYWNRLYRNNGDGTFTDVTEKAGVNGTGYGMGVATGDYDNDGWVDLYVTGVNYNQLFHNNGDGTFTDVTEKAGVAGIHPPLGKLLSISAGWFDYDNDGRLDLFVTNYVNWSLESRACMQDRRYRRLLLAQRLRGQPSMLFHNNGDGTFTDVSETSGIGKIVGKGMGVVFADYDGDGFTDIFVSNDTYRNFLFHNNGDGTFEEMGVTAGVAYNENGKSIAGMGADFRDMDNDGRPDIFLVAMLGDTFPLFHNDGCGFADITASSGIARASQKQTAWGTGMYDLDNDGWKDLIASTGSVLDNDEIVDHLPTKLPNLLLRNIDGKKFANLSATEGPDFQVPRAHRGMAFGDLNNDGKIDVVIVSLNDKPEIWMNHSPAHNHWLLLKLVGTKSNREGLGAKIKVTPEKGIPLYNHATTSVCFSSSSDDRVHFGLGELTFAKTIEIRWPSGIRQVLNDVKADQILTITESR